MMAALIILAVVSLNALLWHYIRPVKSSVEDNAADKHGDVGSGK